MGNLLSFPSSFFVWWFAAANSEHYTITQSSSIPVAVFLPFQYSNIHISSICKNKTEKTHIMIGVIPSILLLLLSTLSTYHYVKPRLPVYVITPILSKIPKLRYVVDCWKTEIVAQVDFFNANYLHLDIHAITFDLLAVDAVGTVRHLGTITDQQQSEIILFQRMQQQQQQPPTITNTTTTAKQSLSKSIGMQPQKVTYKTPDVVWSVDGRTNFTDITTLHVGGLSITNVLNSISSLLSRWWHSHDGVIVLPTTGVAHLKARNTKSAPKIPITLSLICDNQLNTYTMQVTATECIIHEMKPGFSNINKAASAVRDYAMNKIKRINVDSGAIVTPQSNQQGHSWQQILLNIATKEIRQLVEKTAPTTNTTEKKYLVSHKTQHTRRLAR
jgi:hypothetical protein